MIQQIYTIWWHLLCREWQVLARSWQSAGLDSLIVGTIFSLAAGYFMPQMGISRSLSMAVFIGTIAVFCISQGYAISLEIALDLDGKKFMYYHLSLPAPSGVVFAAYVAGMMVRMAVMTVPIFLYGVWVIGDWHMLTVDWVALVSIAVATTLFWSLFFLLLAVGTSTTFVVADIWPRLIGPMFCFGAAFFPWSRLAEKAPLIAKLLSINPMTLCIEGMRAALLGASGYIWVWYCVGALVGYSLLLMYGLRVAARKRFSLPTTYRP